MSLRDGSQKMSKSAVSDMSRINMFDDNDTIINKIKKAKTDAEPFPQSVKDLDGRPEAQNLFNIYAAITNKSLENIITEMNGKQFSDFKKILADALVAELEPINNSVKRLLKDTAYMIMF
jgi:tryptophanyl-tRNA synthetase